MSNLFQNPLASRVGRRIAIVVLVSALVPLATFGSIVFVRARQQAEEVERGRLHQDTKALALNGLERLGMLAQGLEGLAANLNAPAQAADATPQLMAIVDRAEALTFQHPDAASIRRLKGDQNPPALTSDQRDRARAGHPTLIRKDDDASYWLVVGTGAGALVAARVPWAETFGFGEVSVLDNRARLCVLDESRTVVACSDDEARVAVIDAGVSLPTHGEATVAVADVDHLARTWALPLERDYRAGTWTVALMVPRAEAYATLWQLVQDATLLLVSSLIVVILAVLAAVRRSLQPLSNLASAAARIGQQDFDVALEVRTGDEFEALAGGFNTMVGAIRQHVTDLEAFSVGAATALARTIDAKSPWTSGHSERVTALALEIGKAMGLTVQELTVLHRGGLLHDIGKLATPPDILDKPGRLSPEERRQIEQHPRDGVRILEPIPNFAPLLPIVLQHHERYDGEGYPDRVAGENIHLLARVLAVADVFDALRSDRPYREGLPLGQVIDYISAGAGTQFDPRVVSAFVSVMETGQSTQAAPRRQAIAQVELEEALQHTA